MKACILTCYESNEERAAFVKEACEAENFEVCTVTSDFSHIKKQYRNNIPEGYTAIHSEPYEKNLSLKRIFSHIRFSKDAFEFVEKEEPDLIWLMAPANSLIREAKKYKTKHKETVLIIDIIDMWPESLPIRIDKNILPFRIWRDIRKDNITCCDALVTECDFYQETLKKEYPGKMTTIYWPRKRNDLSVSGSPSDDVLSLCYIGSINNLIDTQCCRRLVQNITRPVDLHVIGEGENTESFIESLKSVCNVIYHGAIRDPERKAKIFSKCHAGLNIYKEGLYIGLTVKCIDYFEHGLPIINNIKGDTWKFVAEKGVGINYDGSFPINAEKLIDMRKNNQNIYSLFEENFTKEVFIKKCRNVINEVLK